MGVDQYRIVPNKVAHLHPTVDIEEPNLGLARYTMD
jgi:hypothetical protein